MIDWQMFRRREVVATGFAAGTLAVLLPSSRKVLSLEGLIKSPLLEFKRFKTKAGLNAVAWNWDDSRLAALSAFGKTLTVWETKEWNVISEFASDIPAYSFNSLAYLPDGRLLTSAGIPRIPNSEGPSLRLWDADAGKLIRQIPDPIPDNEGWIGSTDTFAVSPDGRLAAGIVNGSRDSRVLLFETQDWSIIGHVTAPPTPQHSDSAWCLAFSPNCEELAIGTLYGYVHKFNVPEGTIKNSFLAYPGGEPCYAVAYCGDGSVIATGRGQVPLNSLDDGRTRLWRSSDGANIAYLKDFEGGVHKLSWSKNGLLSIAHDQSLVVWDAAAAEPPHAIMRSPGPTFSVAFSKAGILAAARRNEVVLYRTT